MMEFQISRRTNRIAANRELPQTAVRSDLLIKRRVASFNLLGLRDELRTVSLLKRFSKYMVEAIWCSLYYRMYRQMLLDPQVITVYGEHASVIMNKASESLLNRDEAVALIIEVANKILSTDSYHRSDDDNFFVSGLLNQRNQFKDKMCLGWPSYEFNSIVKKLRYVHVNPGRKVCHSRRRKIISIAIINLLNCMMY